MARVSVCLAFSATLAIAPATAWADGSDSLASLLNDTVVTTASQTAETATTAPATSTTLSSDDLRRYGIHTVEEAINFLSLGLSSAGGEGTGNNSELGARGVLIPNDGGRHVLLLVNGHSLNEPLFGTARTNRVAGIPLEMVDHIEIIVGPGSVLYGSNAMLGVINILTKDAATLKGGHVVAESELFTWKRASAMMGAPFHLFGSKGEVTAGIEYRGDTGRGFDVGPERLAVDITSGKPPATRPGGPEDGIWGGSIERSDYAHLSGGLVRFRLGSFEVGLQGRLGKWGLPFAAADFDSPDNTTLERAGSIDAKYRALLTPSLQITTRAYADTYGVQNNVAFSRASACQNPDVGTCRYHIQSFSRWLGAEVQASYDWLRDSRLSTLIGVDGRLRKVGTATTLFDVATDRALGPSAGIVEKNDQIIGAYAQQTWTPVPELGFSAGARIDRDPRFDAVVSPRAAASFQPFPGNTLRTIYSEAFRAPTFLESESSSGTRAKAVDLQPETVRSIEASIEQRFGAQRLLFGAFRTWWKDLIELHTLSLEEAVERGREGRLGFIAPGYTYDEYRNSADIDSYGLNAAVDGSIGEQLRYGINVTNAYSRRRDASGALQPLPAAPRLYGNARLAYDLGENLPTLAVAGFALARRPADRGFDGGFRPVPYAPTQLDLRFTVTGPIPLLKGLSYRASVNWVATGRRGPYVIGPVQSNLLGASRPAEQQAFGQTVSAELDPIDPVRATVGLQYDFLTE